MFNHMYSNLLLFRVISQISSSIIFLYIAMYFLLLDRIYKQAFTPCRPYTTIYALDSHHAPASCKSALSINLIFLCA